MHKRKHKWLIMALFGAMLGFLILIGGTTGYVNWQESQSSNQCGGDQSSTNYNVGGSTTTGNDRQLAQAGYNTFTKLGFSPAAACGALGNLQYESGGHFNIHAQEYGGGGGYGLPQFTGRTLNQARQIASQQHFNFDTVEGQIETLVYSIEHGGQWISNDGVSYNDFKKSNDVKGATKSFEFDYERPDIHARDASLSARQQDAEQWFASFSKGNDKATTAGANFASANANGAEPAKNGECSVSTSNTGANGNILQIANQLKGYFTYAQVRPPQIAKNGNADSVKSINDVNRNGRCDCSGYVWLVYKLAGYNVPNGCWYTGSMASDANGAHHWLKAVSPQQAKAGDCVIVNLGPSGAGDLGHTAILLQNWHGDSTMIIDEGGFGGGGGVNVSTFAQAFYPKLRGGTMTFAEPVK